MMHRTRFQNCESPSWKKISRKIKDHWTSGKITSCGLEISACHLDLSEVAFVARTELWVTLMLFVKSDKSKENYSKNSGSTFHSSSLLILHLFLSPYHLWSLSTHLPMKSPRTTTCFHWSGFVPPSPIFPSFLPTTIINLKKGPGLSYFSTLCFLLHG